MSDLLDINDVRKRQIDILDFVDKTLKKHNICYWLDAGTLLGCVRHKGYIPWDDDIDICMRRNDYERIADIINSEDSPYKVLNMHNTKGYYYLFAKVVDTHTHIIEKGIPEIPEMGIYIDVFPLDNLPKDKKTCSRIINKVFRYRSIVYYSLLNKNQIKAAKIITKIKCLISIIYGKDRALSKANNICLKVNSIYNENLADIVGAAGKGHIVPASYFKDTINGLFEGREYYIPKKYHEYLSVVYGDYMSLPPKEKQVLTHDFKAYFR